MPIVRCIRHGTSLRAAILPQPPVSYRLGVESMILAGLVIFFLIFNQIIDFFACFDLNDFFDIYDFYM